MLFLYKPQEKDKIKIPAHIPIAIELITTKLRDLFLQIFRQAICNNITNYL